uniref:J domain-containing protein n=1 Tax=Steinernema glaseri TaxID=37863 RepID=A0A1I8AV45_9BILA
MSGRRRAFVRLSSAIVSFRNGRDALPATLLSVEQRHRFVDMSDFDQFYSDLKKTENKDAKLTSKQQLDRLLKPGSTYLNLNPFEVLQIDPETDLATARKKYKQLSLLIHPDRNAAEIERAQKAFDVIKKAMEQLEDPDELGRCRDTYTEARARLAIAMSEKRRKQKKDGRSGPIEEDTPEGYNKALWVTVTKMFADREKKRRGLEERANEEKKRLAEDQRVAAEKRKMEEEYQKTYEETRDDRRGSWRDFVSKKAKKASKGNTFAGAGFRPPKSKLETSTKK